MLDFYHASYFGEGDIGYSRVLEEGGIQVLGIGRGWC